MSAADIRGRPDGPVLPIKGGGEDRTTYGWSSGPGKDHPRTKDHHGINLAAELDAVAAERLDRFLCRQRDRRHARDQLDHARTHGLRARHAAKLARKDHHTMTDQPATLADALARFQANVGGFRRAACRRSNRDLT